MVSSAVNLTLQEILETLERFRQAYTDDQEYRQLRARFPADWPM